MLERQQKSEPVTWKSKENPHAPNRKNSQEQQSPAAHWEPRNRRESKTKDGAEYKTAKKGNW